MAEALHTLADEQANASHPRGDVWLSASAGTGKTQVLSARVLRLLLHGARAEGILCLTFTKAGAAEMRERIHERLGAWVTMPGPDLGKDLQALGEDHGPDMRQHARRLFADLLDARGSGLRIQTIHSFCQSLLASFPAEADLPPGFRAVDERETAQLHRQALARLAEEADDDAALRVLLETLSLELGEDATRSTLERCAAIPDVMESLGLDLAPRVRQWLGLGECEIDEQLREACADGGFDRAALDCFRSACARWGKATGQAFVDTIDSWLALRPEDRANALDAICAIWCKQDGAPRAISSGLLRADPECEAHATALFDHFTALIELRRRGVLAKLIAASLIAGKAYSRHYAEVKRADGAVDFDDLIRETAALLSTPGMGDWIRYKLDRETDHILIDEAQDTNARQWAIVKALAEEFYSGDGAREGVARTLFTVGDHKQAIFGFQGTSPREFGRARAHFSMAITAIDRELGEFALNRSYRSGQPILDVVDHVVAEIGSKALGLDREAKRHVSAIAGGSGQVVLWPPVAGIEEESEESDDPDRISNAELDFARDLAAKVRDWTSGGLMLRNKGRAARPEDVLILVRSRGELARLIVSRLYEAGVEVAGIDRLRLNAPIAVQDLLACIRFVLQPDDDLNLAALLVSPLVGCDQDHLWQAGKGRDRKTSLWRHIADDRPSELREMLRIADTSTPYRFLEAILSGAIGGRRRMIARLGEEARDPIEALLNAALDFERQSPPSLQLFIDWFDRGDVDIKRDAAKPDAAVRVMTVHGAKGLQAPIVVLADAAHSFERRPRGSIDWDVGFDQPLPVFRPRKAVRAGRIVDAVDAADARELEEHWRLLYVAMTRAEEHLFIGGAVRPRERGKPLAETVWHERVARAMRGLGADSDADGALRFAHEAPIQKTRRKEDAPLRWKGALPIWLSEDAPAEARPPRPLAPSAAEVADDVADPPPSPADREAAERGRLLHALFERLPAVAPGMRRDAALRWLARQGAADAQDIADHALAVLAHPDYAEVFAPDALAEAPIAGVVDGRVIAGSVDRLLVRSDQVLVIDFKTGRRVPNSSDALPRAHVAQMAAYVAVLQSIFPDRTVRAGLLYTTGPKLITVPSAMLDAFKPGYREAQEKFDAAG